MDNVVRDPRVKKLTNEATTDMSRMSHGGFKTFVTAQHGAEGYRR